MTYIENIFLCLALPPILSLFFTSGGARRFMLFFTIGMSACLLSAYVSSFFMGYYGTDAGVAAAEIAPVCEEIMKLIPLVLYFLIFEPNTEELPAAAIAIAVGFATFENACYLTENGAENLSFMLIRGVSAGALHLLCGIAAGFGIAQVFRRRWLAVTGTAGILGACTAMHAIYNLLISAEGAWQAAGYLIPSIAIVCLFIGKQALKKKIKL